VDLAVRKLLGPEKDGSQNETRWMPIIDREGNSVGSCETALRFGSDWDLLESFDGRLSILALNKKRSAKRPWVVHASRPEDGLDIE
jgi:hypothetical protein